jgi:hypothetical protein
MMPPNAMNRIFLVTKSCLDIFLFHDRRGCDPFGSFDPISTVAYESLPPLGFLRRYLPRRVGSSGASTMHCAADSGFEARWVPPIGRIGPSR